MQLFYYINFFFVPVDQAYPTFLAIVKLPSPHPVLKQSSANDTILHTVHREMENVIIDNDPCPLAPALHEASVPNPKDPKMTAISHG